MHGMKNLKFKNLKHYRDGSGAVQNEFHCSTNVQFRSGTSLCREY